MICPVTPLQRAKLERQSQVGFVHEADGSLVAYAGGRKFPLPEGHYVWQITPETQQTHKQVTEDRIGRLLGTISVALFRTGATALKIAGRFACAFAHVGGGF